MSTPVGETKSAWRCVVLTEPNCPAPSRLLGSLRRRGLTVRSVDRAPLAMAELATSQPAILILVEPQRQPRLRELTAAVRCHFADTHVWQYDARGGLGWFVDTGRRGERRGASHATEMPQLTAEELAMLLGGDPTSRAEAVS